MINSSHFSWKMRTVISYDISLTFSSHQLGHNIEHKGFMQNLGTCMSKSQETQMYSNWINYHKKLAI